MSQIKKVLVHETKPVSAGAVITTTIPSFDTIDDILLTFTNSGAAATQANIISSIGKVALAINGEQVINCNISQLFDLFGFLGTHVVTGTVNVISLNIGRLMMDLVQNKDYFAWGCDDIQTIQVQVYCGGTITGVTDVQFATERRAFKSKLGSYIKVINYPQNMASTGYSTVDTLPRDTNDGYLAVLAYNGGGVIATGECTMNGENIIDEQSLATAGYIAKTRKFNSAFPSGGFQYLFSDGSARGILPMNGVTDLRFKTQFTTAPTGGVYDMLAVSVKNMPAEMVRAVNA